MAGGTEASGEAARGGAGNIPSAGWRRRRRWGLGPIALVAMAGLTLGLVAIGGFWWSVWLRLRGRGELRGPEWRALRAHQDGAALAFSPDGKTFASGGDPTVQLWDTRTWQARRTLAGHARDVWSLAFAPDSRTLASGSSDETIKLWRVATGQELATFAGHTDFVVALAFSPDGQTLASGSWDHTVKLWDLTTKRERATLRGHTYWVECLAFSPDGTRLASGSTDRTVRLWDVATGSQRVVLEDWTMGPVGSVAFTPDGTRLAASMGPEVWLWDARTLERVGSFTPRRAMPPTEHAWLSPDGRLLVVDCDVPDIWTSQLWVWAVGPRRLVARFPPVHGHAPAVAFSPDGRLLASGSTDQIVRLWKLPPAARVWGTGRSARPRGSTREGGQAVSGPKGPSLRRTSP